MKLTAKATIQIQKSKNEVFDAIVNPNKMNQYFIASSTGAIETGKIVEWKFPEFDDIFPVMGGDLKQDEYISFDWSGGVDDMLVEIFLEKGENNSTIVKVIEHEMNDDEAGIKQLMGQTEGWANFLACLKAYLEYGINLRKGAFDFMKP
ncbi:SRPBCC domain-containing protein [Empedobacter falsenii]|uniref:SRPBCC domain-containing protein n=1 Tax=Empedobacter falsenii TaxID=343874 RepID=A0AAW7DGV9_9FLAO|nr:SRPBCC domain-containing protein [Empedobacter falsenii]MDM1551239.1 SRPBCC domain-containing protein [Empedobacter falsenii]